MSFTLQNVIPWGRSFEEYVAMFALTAADLNRSILGCSDGPAAFNARLNQRGGTVTSIDPIYQFSAAKIRARIAETHALVLEQMRKNRADFVWESIASPKELGRTRTRAMDEFIRDFPLGKKSGRYLAGALPQLPFEDQQFALALCSHFLFLYGDSLSSDFHVESILELCRVAQEVRIFPLIELSGERSRHLGAVERRLRSEGYCVAIQTVSYCFQRGGDQMMRIVPFARKGVEPAPSPC